MFYIYFTFKFSTKYIQSHIYAQIQFQLRPPYLVLFLKITTLQGKQVLIPFIICRIAKANALFSPLEV